MISKIRLENFRNISSKLLTFSEKTTVIVGPNAAGKTNILESLFLLSTGKSFKVKVESEMIRHGSELTRVKGKTDSETLEVLITTGANGWPRKKLLVNNVAKRLIDFTGAFKVVLFGPWDMDLVTGSPSVRRRLLDTVLSQVDREYRRAISSYEKGLRQRNRLLLRIREEGLSRSNLLFWDQLLIKNGNYITDKREEFVEFVNSKKFLPNGSIYELTYDKSTISEARLMQYEREEVASATTLVGPHRDDIVFKVKEKEKSRDLSIYGSRGEARMAVLWIKIAELAYTKEKTGERPTLLLDDIFSELDHEHRDIVMKVAKEGQTIITTADPHYLGKEKDFTKIELKG